MKPSSAPSSELPPGVERVEVLLGPHACRWHLACGWWVDNYHTDTNRDDFGSTNVFWVYRKPVPINGVQPIPGDFAFMGSADSLEGAVLLAFRVAVLGGENR